MVVEDNFEFKIHESKPDILGRYIILDIELVGVARFLIVNIYAPNNDSPEFFNNLFLKIENSDTKNLVIVGDWNLVMNFDLDTLNYKIQNNTNAIKTVLKFMDKLDLTDIWRTNHETNLEYTWRQEFHKKKARLDFFLISESLLDIYADSKIKPSYKSDHCPVQLKLFISTTKKGKGIWKLNNSLLLDDILTTQIKNEIELTVGIYACTPYNPAYVKENYNTAKIDLMINIDLFWEVLQAQLRGRIISYGAGKKGQQNNRETILTREIELATRDIHLHNNDKDWLEQLASKKEELEELREQKLKGALIRARWHQLTEGEKPTKYVLNLENRNYVSKHIRELKVNNKTVTNPKDILDEMKFFYQNLYNKKDTVNIEDTSFANLGNQLPKLNERDKSEIERDICLEDLKHTVFKSKNNKSPGPDGFSNEFYKQFWPRINILLLKLMNFYRLNAILNAAQTTGIITCIPKGGKVRNDLKNWRPLTLLNSIYKFFSGILAERIKKILPKLIHLDQKGFINGRFIGENTRITSDIINECNSQN